MAVGDAKYQGLLIGEGIEVIGQELTHQLVEGFVLDNLVDLADIEVQLVLEVYIVNVLLGGIVIGQLLTHPVVDTLLVVPGFDMDGWLVIDQITINHGFPVAVNEDWLPEDLGGVQCRGRSEANFDGIKVIHHSSVLGDVVTFGAEGNLDLVELPVQQVAPVALIHHDAIVLVDGGLIIRGEQGALDHALHGSHVDLGIAIRGGLCQPLDIEGISKGLLVEHLGGFKGIGGLFPQGAAVHQEQDAAKALGLKQSVNQCNSCLGFACAGGHRQQDIVLAHNDGILYRADGFYLVGPQVKIEVEMLVS